ncbi:MAG: WYL domain-containing protein [Chloroflexi bacterium]|nr:WYL domain-containing protein [Chloroflexota bacterium]MBP8059970.1 WYL domain-containing protein [Chloroflexota bacterium]
MSRGMNRAERLREMERLYVQRGFTDIEMAERLDVKRTTVWKDRTMLEAEVPFVQDENGRWRIDKSRYLSAIRVNLHEALALYLAARRVSRQTRIAQPHVASGLEKLAAALKQPMAERLVNAAATVLTQLSQPERISTIEVVTQAWVESRKLQIVYRALDARHALTHTITPLLIEPSLWSDSTYLIARLERTGKPIPFKIERIEQAILLPETFTVEAGFDEQTLLEYAWGIWYSENEPVTVELRFAPGQPTRRVKETVWHPKEQVTDTPDGGCMWSAPVAEWQEMLPWIRGWGSDCEVVRPLQLRETLMGEARAMAEQYGWFVNSHPRQRQSATADFFG